MTTQRFLPFALFAALVPASLGAQPATDSSVHVGLLGGVTLTRVAWAPAPAFDIDWTTNGTVGVSFERRIRGPLFVETRVQWSRKGAEAQLQDHPLVTGRFWVDYLSVPALLKVKGGGRLRPYLSGGLEVNTKLAAKARVSIDGQGTTEEMGDDASATDVVLDVAGGIEIPAGRRALFVEALYGHGLSHVANLLPAMPGSDEIKVRTRTLQVVAGIRF